MSDVKYAVIAIGDSSYDTFCAAGKHADELLEDIGGTRIADSLLIDILEQAVPEDAAEAWIKDRIEQFK
ncbi:flavoprotein MioC [Vibrio astriarenae]|nr:flavoprotein MioC [Vibrio sp. C7]